jgi:hypothetical protein
MVLPLDLTRQIAEMVSTAGGIFKGFWETPAGLWAVVTEPLSLSTTIAPVAGISVSSIDAALTQVRQRFAIDPAPDASPGAASPEPLRDSPGPAPERADALER